MKKVAIFLAVSLIFSLGFAQTFETPQIDGQGGQEVKANLGADFALQYQAISQSADSALIPLGSNVNVPTANLRISALLAQGVKVNLTTYLSSRHHLEAWVKGGYLIFDELPFVNISPVNEAMQYLTLKVGVMELNYGDAHFRRSDNGSVNNNKFVGNNIMDAFTTAPAAELLYRKDGIILMGALTGGTLKPSLSDYSTWTDQYSSYDFVDEAAVYGKAGYDKNFTDDLRIRGTASLYYSAKNHFGSLYYGERTGSRYYLVMKEKTFSEDDVDPASDHTTGRWGPGFNDELTSFMGNLFTKYNNIEAFATYEKASGTGAFSGSEFDFSQFAIEGLYYFGGNNQFYGGARYNKVENDQDKAVNRIQLIAGWQMTDNITTKLEYVNQSYDGFEATYGSDASFSGLMFEGGVSF